MYGAEYNKIRNKWAGPGQIYIGIDTTTRSLQEAKSVHSCMGGDTLSAEDPNLEISETRRPQPSDISNKPSSIGLHEAHTTGHGDWVAWHHLSIPRTQ